MAVVREAEAVVARAPVVPRDVDALVDTSSVIIGRALIDVCSETQKRETNTQERTDMISIMIK